MIKTGSRTTRSEVHKFIICIWNREELPEDWKDSIIVPIYKKGDKTDCSNNRGISLLPNTYKSVINILLYRLTPYAGEIIRIISVDIDATSQLLIIYSAFVKYLGRKGIQ